MQTLLSRFEAALRVGLLLATCASCAPSDFDKRKADEPDCTAELDGGACGPAEEEPVDAARDPAMATTDASAQGPVEDARNAAGPEAGETPDPPPDADLAQDASLLEDAACDACDDASDEGTWPPVDAMLRSDAGPSGPCDGGPPLCMANELDMEMRGCGACGAGVQTRARTCLADGCGYGAWSAWSACSGNDSECTPNESDEETRACGLCGAGMQRRTRSCVAATCSWSAFSAWSECSGGTTQCMPGAVDEQVERCGACGTGSRKRTRTCSTTTCSWGAWGAWSACAGVTAACTPGQTMGCSPADSCGHRVCNDSCQWGGCVPRVAGGCLRRRGGTQEEGSNYRCCGDGRWQFCLPECTWSSACAGCSPTNCEC